MDFLPVPHNKMLQLYLLVGELIINWTLLDSMITKMVAAVYHGAGGRDHAPRMPFPFSRRVKFLRHCVAKIPELVPLAQTMAAVLKSAQEISPIRDALNHGAITGYAQRSGVFAFSKLDIGHGDEFHVANTVNISLDTLQGAVIASQETMRVAIALLERILDLTAR